MRYEIDPEPSAEEREVLLEALRRLEQADAGAGAWARADDDQPYTRPRPPAPPRDGA